MAKGDADDKSSKGEPVGAAEAKGAKGVAEGGGGGGGAKAAAKYDDDVWSKETDYCDWIAPPRSSDRQLDQ